MIRRMQIIHWVVMAINLMFCLSVMVLARRSAGRVRREHDSTCERILREGSVEIERLKYLVQAQQGTIRGHKEQIADRDATIENLRADCENHAKRILSLEDSYSQKCLELEAKNREVERMSWEVDAGRSVKAAVVELIELLREFLLGMNGARAKNLFAPETFQPKRPEEQPQKPMCDN